MSIMTLGTAVRRTVGETLGRLTPASESSERLEWNKRMELQYAEIDGIEFQNPVTVILTVYDDRVSVTGEKDVSVHYYDRVGADGQTLQYYHSHDTDRDVWYSANTSRGWNAKPFAAVFEKTDDTGFTLAEGAGWK